METGKLAEGHPLQMKSAAIMERCETTFTKGAEFTKKYGNEKSDYSEVY